MADNKIYIAFVVGLLLLSFMVAIHFGVIEAEDQWPQYFTTTGKVATIERVEQILGWGQFQGYSITISNFAETENTKIYAYTNPAHYPIRAGDVITVDYRVEKWGVPSGGYRLVPLVEDYDYALNPPKARGGS